jgi:pimeloyl-ACP methyl ester carboxylesterase
VYGCSRLTSPATAVPTRPKPRTLASFARDVHELTRGLELTSVSLFGESGGGPQALAAATALQDRVGLTVIAAGMASIEDQAFLRDMKPANRRLLALGRRAPVLLRLPMAITRRKLLDPQQREGYVQAQLAQAGPADRAALVELMARGDITAATRDALRAGTRAVASELAMLARPWGIDLSMVTSRVELWHGRDDVNVPPAAALSLAERLPHAVVRIIDGEGHAVGWMQRHALMASLAGSVATAEVDR